MATTIPDIEGAARAFPTNDAIDRMWHFAEKIAPAKFIPPVIRGDVPSVFYLMATAEEMDLTWTHALRGMYLTGEGALAMKGEIMLALLQSHGFGVQLVPQETPVGCSCTITRPGETEGKTRAFTMEDATRTRIYFDREAKEWRTLADTMRYRNYGGDMCQWRSLARCARVQAADLMGGVYLPEELAEVAEQAGQDARAGAEAQPPVKEMDDEFAVGEKEASPETEAPFDETPTPITVATAAPAETIAAPPETVRPADKPAAPVIEMPKPPAAPPKYVLYLAIPREGQQPELVACGAETPQANMEAAKLRARAIANDKKMACVGIKTVEGITPTEADVAFVCNPPSAALPTPTAAAARERTASEEKAFHEAKDGAAPVLSFDEMITLVRAKIGGDQKDANALIARYFKAYLQSATVPKDRAKLHEPLRQLVKVIVQRLEELKASPEGLGNALAGRAKGILESQFDLMGWSASLRDLGRKVMAAAALDEAAFVQWIQFPAAGDPANGTGLSIAQLDAPALNIFLPLYLLVAGRSFEPIDFAISHSRGVTQTLEEMVIASKPIAEWDVPYATKILDAIKAVAAEDTPPAPEPPAVDDWANGGLPFEQ